jgi:hypothetical protein
VVLLKTKGGREQTRFGNHWVILFWTGLVGLWIGFVCSMCGIFRFYHQRFNVNGYFPRFFIEQYSETHLRGPCLKSSSE